MQTKESDELGKKIINKEYEMWIGKWKMLNAACRIPAAVANCHCSTTLCDRKVCVDKYEFKICFFSLNTKCWMQDRNQIAEYSINKYFVKK